MIEIQAEIPLNLEGIPDFPALALTTIAAVEAIPGLESPGTVTFKTAPGTGNPHSILAQVTGLYEHTPQIAAQGELLAGVVMVELALFGAAHLPGYYSIRVDVEVGPEHAIATWICPELATPHRLSEMDQTLAHHLGLIGEIRQSALAKLDLGIIDALAPLIDHATRLLPPLRAAVMAPGGVQQSKKA